MRLWNWLNTHDIANWLSVVIGLALTAIGSVATYFFQKRRVRHVAGLEVWREPGHGNICSESSPLLRFKFVNKTGRTVYLKNPSLRAITDRLSLHAKTAQDSATGSCELKFRSHTGFFDVRHCILQTDGECETAIYTADTPDSDLVHFRAPRWRRVLRWPKYFVLQYFAVLEDRTYRVKTII
jgi:hypothetical protein